MSLGGVRDEAEIRGHRRTYVGALPGKVIQMMKRVGTVNPVLLLDEIDKMSSDFRGDPASALLEVLDPEQNRTFNDHYLEVDYDLSRVMFVTTANSTEGIPAPLLDRMELIRLTGYTPLEKRAIATQFLIRRQEKDSGLSKGQVRIQPAALDMLIDSYTKEAGVRNLDREIASVCRKVATDQVRAWKGARQRKKTLKVTVSTEWLRERLGPPKFRDSGHTRRAPEVGTALGLAWTEVGGELLPVETTIMPGKGGLELTGKLGDVMKESAKIALSWIRAHGSRLGIPADRFRDVDIHVHVPEGAIPKDGPSAGITMALSMASALSGIPVRQDLAMTGEVTLRGRVLKIGGLKEKALAAHRFGIPCVLLPKENEDEIDELPAEVRSVMAFVPVESLDEVFDRGLCREDSPARTPEPRGKARPRSRGRSYAS
jgi:ATP-dependent Lon protease